MSFPMKHSSLPDLQGGSLPLSQIHNEQPTTRGIKHSPSFIDVSMANTENFSESSPRSELNGNPSIERVGVTDNTSNSIKDPTVNDKKPTQGRIKKMVGDWILGQTIGEGTSGKVKIAFHSRTHESCVVKAVKRPELPSSSQTPVDPSLLRRIHKRELLMIREAALGMVLDHPNIVRLHSTILQENYFYCFFEYVSGHDLVDYVSMNGKLGEEESRAIFRQIVSAVEYAHRNHVVHRDIKLENIRYDPVTAHAKLLDFGFSTFFMDSKTLSTNCGSPCYASPEIYDNRPYKGPEIDIWSLGICLFGMLTGSLPFDGPSFNTLSKRVKSGKIAFPSYISEGARDLISKMLHPKAASRLSMAGLLSHPWTNQVYPFHPVDYQKFPESRTDTSLINLEFVESLMSSNTASAASALMDVLAEYGPKRKAQLAKERNSSTKSHVTLTPSSSVTFATSNSGHAGEEDERTVVTGNNSSEGLSPALLSEIGNACNSKGKMERLQKRIRPRQQKARQRVLTASQSVRDWWSRVLHQSASIFKKRGAKKTDNVIPMEMTSEEPFGTATRGRNSALLRGGTQKSRKLPHHLRFSTSF